MVTEFVLYTDVLPLYLKKLYRRHKLFILKGLWTDFNFQSISVLIVCGFQK